ncbi:unnamed protein product [Nezara viridula]|uniref:MADF domain-containing protein n=1 Tax=Nezara viridula TaxID=85310 RepID=A0A9P0HQF8_NEZVI|nr:unnamed protein product [Nezara viridula]
MSHVRIDLIHRFDIIDFLEEYQKFPCLWKKCDPNFKNRIEREAAEKSLLETFKFASAKELRQKIRSIRGTYNQERNKVRNSLLTGLDIYKPKLIWFDLADSFLRQNEMDTEHDSFQITEEEDCLHGEIEKKEEMTPEQHQTEPSTSHQLSLSNSQHPTPSRTYAHMISRNQKRKRERVVPQNRRNIAKLVDSLDNAVNVLKEVSSRSPSDNSNEFVIFGNHVASQLQTLPLAEALQLQAEIQSLITSVRVQCLQNNSSVMNEQLVTTVQPQCVVATLSEPYPCERRPCNRKYKPVCAEKVVNGKLERKTFSNYCMMEAANDCGGGYSVCNLQEDDDQEQ